MRAWVALVVLGAMATPALAAEGGGLAFIERELAAWGLNIAQMPDPLQVQAFDLATGASWTEPTPRDGFLAEVAALLAAPPQAADAPHRVVGEVSHACFDVFRWCYRFTTDAAPVETRTDATQPAHDALAAAYQGTPASSLARFPLRGGQAFYVQGAYAYGSHTANLPLGDTGTHADRAMWGAGVGTARLVASPWGPGMLNSLGVIRAHGVWTFCDTEDDLACAAP